LRHLKELYPEEFAGLYVQAFEKYPSFGGNAGERFKKAAAERTALEILRERHGIVK
jgi:hypothetical protein